MAGGGTEAFPDLGRHCQHSDCNQLDFLPFRCDACQKVFCVEHRSCKSHDCPKSDHNSRKVLVCDICSVSIETTGYEGEDEKLLLEKHEKSGNCDPTNKKKPTCPVRRCKEVLTFSNTSTCKLCQLQVCLKHRFPADHVCSRKLSSSSKLGLKDWRETNNMVLVPLASRNAKDCGNTTRKSTSPPSTPSVKAY